MVIRIIGTVFVISALGGVLAAYCGNKFMRDHAALPCIISGGLLVIAMIWTMP